VKENGGQYNLNRNDKGMWDPTFLSTAFRLKEGQISNVFRSKFGLHILQLVSRSGDDAVVRHILRIPTVTEDEIKDAKSKLDSIRVKIQTGVFTFNEAVNKHSDDENSKFNGGAISNKQDGSNYLTFDVLDKDMVTLLKGLKVGDVSVPQSFTDERGRNAVRMILLKSRTEPHRENLKDDYDRVAKRVMEEKKEHVMRKWFAEHIPGYYINIDKDFAGCKNLEQWRHGVNNATAAQ